MADTFTSILALRLQQTGNNADSWGQKLNDEVIQFVEDKFVGQTVVNTTGGDTALTATQRRVSIIKVTGTLVSNVKIIVPNSQNDWFVWNATTEGAFCVQVATASGAGDQIATIPQDTVKRVVCNGADSVWRLDRNQIGEVFLVQSNMTVPVGAYNMPTDATPVSRTGKYREIFRLWGTVYGAGDGVSTFVRPYAPTAAFTPISSFTVNVFFRL